MNRSKVARIVDALFKQHRIAVIVLHIGLLLGSLILAWSLVSNVRLPLRTLVLLVAPLLLLFRLSAMARCTLLHGNWRYTGVDDATEIVRAITFGSVGFFVCVRFLLGLHELPLSFFVVETLTSMFMLAGVRLAFRIFAEMANRRSSDDPSNQVLIIGAGFAAQMVLREIRHKGRLHSVVGCVDDDQSKIGQKIQGKRVLGTVEQLPEIVAKHGIREVLIAIPSATGAQMRRFVNICEAAGVKSSTVPALHDLISGRASINEIHQVNLNDLLGRETVELDLKAVRHVLTGKVVLVTGAAGSIGSELCRQILEYQPAKLVCVDQNETGLFYLEMELRAKPGGGCICLCVGDYTDADQMSGIFSEHLVQAIFHAAAYKHVPLMEQNPRVALANNVFGLARFIEVAQQFGCESFVLISSDKAVNPSSVMGCTKRIGELILACQKSGAMKCVSVRFGNVLGSQGSVIPVFQKQLMETGRITVTHADITRFFMTITEAVSLVLQAAAIGNNCDILVLDMGEPVRIVDLARTLIRLSGKSEKDVEIVFTGLRQGEKLFEELFYAEERVLETSCEKIKRTSSPFLNWPELKLQLDDLRAGLYTLDDDEIRNKIQEIVPEYCYEPKHTKALAAGASAAGQQYVLQGSRTRSGQRSSGYQHS